MNVRSARRHSVAIGLMLAVLLAGCPHDPNRATSHPAVAHATDVEHVHKPAPPKGGPLPPQRVVEPADIDRSCQADADCVAKDTGSGALPSCVTRDRSADPAAAQAACEQRSPPRDCSRGGLKPCACLQGHCVAGGNTLGGDPVDVVPSPPEFTH